MKPTNGIFSFTHHATSVNVKDNMGLFPKLYQEHKVGISVNLLVIFIIVTHKFSEKCYLIFKLIIMY